MYSRNLKRIFWLEFIDEQNEMSRARQMLAAPVSCQDAPATSPEESRITADD
jgi:hypothetical protein